MHRARPRAHDFRVGSLAVFARRALVVAALSLAAGTVEACYGATCAAGQISVCKDDGDCRCGAECLAQRDCTGIDICAPLRNRPTGACVDVVWLYGGNPPPCLLLCTGDEICVSFTEGRGTCGRPCTADDECAGCCVPLQGGGRVCAPANICTQYFPCGTSGCAEGTSCIDFGSGGVCAAACVGDDQCGETCCVPLTDGSGVCAPPRSLFCPSTPPPPVCRSLDDCTRNSARATPGTERTCGAGSAGTVYEGSVQNLCAEPAECVACWWSPSTNAYTDCSRIATLAPGATAPLGEARCLSAAPPSPAVRVKCVDQASAFGSSDCLSNANP